MLLDELEKNGVEVRVVIGEVIDGDAGHIEVVSG
jgi:6,7-dimethyl-8-ribityllumazine synthase